MLGLAHGFVGNTLRRTTLVTLNVVALQNDVFIGGEKLDSEV